MTDIQQARDVLAKWRSESALVDYQPWSIRSNYPPETRVLGADSDDVANPGDYAASNAFFDSRTARLIVGTAGNSDLLDAIDEMLAAADVPPVPITVPVILLAKPLAAAIISADERMNA